ncbi:hypothetical protein [Brevifollis gellanilyticus]|uniref:Uncharacterized protein n=1 Tax=Brevifollis gellanilyticus TaxID=748831 RepID=A0A512M7U6_9BACT|nr:hypothetical protein [Brevifollis gellanilyticus]GEP42421.1 hypothetical protein BGE01nite_17120 [Brevifollis gellanilyticus]
MILCLESSILGGYLSNEVPGLVTGQLHLAGLGKPVRVELVGNFMRDIAGCRVDFHNPLPNGDLDDVAWLSPTQVGFTGVMTASNRVSKLPRRRRAGDTVLPDPAGLKNLLFFEWFNEQSQRILIQSWHLHLRVSAPRWQLSAEEDALQFRQARARRKHFLLASSNANDGTSPALHAPGMADPFEPKAPGGDPFADFGALESRSALASSDDKLPPDPTKRAMALAQELRRFERLLSQTHEVRNRPAVVQLLSTVADLAAHLVHVLRQFSAADKSGWHYLVIDLEQSLPLFSAALNATDRLVQQSTPGTDKTWLGHVQASLLNIELRMRELLGLLR